MVNSAKVAIYVPTKVRHGGVEVAIGSAAAISNRHCILVSGQATLSATSCAVPEVTSTLNFLENGVS